MKQLQVGDQIRVRNAYNDFILTIVRTTKTQAIAKTPFNNECKFKLEYGTYPTRLPRIRFDTTTYTVLDKK